MFSLISIFIGSDYSLEVDLFDTSDSSVDVNIGEMLVNEGLASWRSPSSSIPSPEIKPFSALQKPQPSANEKVFVSAVESPGSFYCQISGSEDKLASLMSEISAVYDSISSHDLAVTSISARDVCCAQFSEDNQWYRAVIEENNDDNLTVRFIDYGNLETLPISRTKVLSGAFFGEPPLAIKCSLHGIQPLTGQAWSGHSAVSFENLTSEKELDATFLSFSEPFEIQLRDNTKYIGEELVRTGLAAAKSASPMKYAVNEFTKPDIACGEMYDVCITHISSPGRFYCQLVNLSDQLDGSK